MSNFSTSLMVAGAACAMWTSASAATARRNTEVQASAVLTFEGTVQHTNISACPALNGTLGIAIENNFSNDKGQTYLKFDGTKIQTTGIEIVDRILAYVAEQAQPVCMAAASQSEKKPDADPKHVFLQSSSSFSGIARPNKNGCTITDLTITSFADLSINGVTDQKSFPPDRLPDIVIQNNIGPSLLFKEPTYIIAIKDMSPEIVSRQDLKESLPTNLVQACMPK